MAETLAVPQLAGGPPVVVEAPKTGKGRPSTQHPPPQTEEELKVPRSSIRASIQASFLLRPKTAAEFTDPVPVNSTTIKVVPYINARQMTGIALLVLWPVVLGTVFNVYGFQEASSYLGVRLDIQHYVERVSRTQQLVDLLIEQQGLLLASLIDNDRKANDIAKNSSEIFSAALLKFNLDYPEIERKHSRTTPKHIATVYKDWIANISDFNEVEPVDIVEKISNVTRDVRMFFAAFHDTTQDGGDTWNNVLQQLFISEVSYRIKDAQTFGNFAYRKTEVGKPISPQVRRPLLQRIQRVIMALDLYAKYTLPDYQLENVQKVCGSDCQWNFLRTRNVDFWRELVRSMVALGKPGELAKVVEKTQLPADSNITVVGLWKVITDEMLYPIDQAEKVCTKVVTEQFQEDLDISIAVFAVILGFLVAWLIFTPNLLLLVSSSLAGIFSESYRFQWIQLCRRRAIEREKSRSDKIVQEMFFEVNFKYLYEGNLPPTVLYKEATIAFVELLQYDELCKIYTTVDHVALLDWYYHLVNASVKGFNTNVVATAGHYCLLAGTHAYHAQNVALSMLRLMTLVKESFLPPPHETRLPLIRAGIHTGPVAGCIVSLKFPLFTMLGDTVNTSARMNSKSKPFRVLLSEVTNQIVSTNFITEFAGVFNVKGKGDMKTYWLMACKWRTFAEYTINMGEADHLTKLHDLEAAQSHARNSRRTGFGQSNTFSVFDVDHGRRRSSSENDGSIAVLGEGLLQSLIKKVRKKKPSVVAIKEKKEVLIPLVFPQPVTPKPGDTASFYSKEEISIAFAQKERKASYKDYTVPRLSTDIDVKMSPNESYYMQISNNIYTRSWNAHRDNKAKEKEKEKEKAKAKIKF